MSCWVVPTIAAEMWGVSLNQVVARMASGSVPTRIESGWTFIDIAPDSPTMQMGTRIKPPTYTILTDEETAALNATPPGNENDSEVSSPEDSAPVEEPSTDESTAAHEDDAESPDLSWQNWHRVRKEVGRTRRRPPMAA